MQFAAATCYLLLSSLLNRGHLLFFDAKNPGICSRSERRPQSLGARCIAEFTFSASRPC
jgi:hypothetical protein